MAAPLVAGMRDQRRHPVRVEPNEAILHIDPEFTPDEEIRLCQIDRHDVDDRIDFRLAQLDAAATAAVCLEVMRQDHPL
jgi:hypothetical protein